MQDRKLLAGSWAQHCQLLTKKHQTEKTFDQSTGLLAGLSVSSLTFLEN